MALTENQCILPTEMIDGGDESRRVLENSGVKFLSPIENEPLYQLVELPEGWKVITDEDTPWCSLVDNKGRRRARILDEPKFAYQSAFIELCSRFTVMFGTQLQGSKEIITVVVLDCNRAIYSTEPICLSAGKYSPDLINEAYDQCNLWLDEKYPDWRDPAAYWDEPDLPLFIRS